MMKNVKKKEKRVVEKKAVQKKDVEKKIEDAKEATQKSIVEQVSEPVKIIEEKEESTNDAIGTYNSKFKSSKSKGQSRNLSSKGLGKGAGALGIVNSPSSCMKITIGGHVNRELNYPKEYQFSFSDNELAIAEKLPDNENYFYPRGETKTKKTNIYSAELVREITKIYNLDFEGRTSHTFYDVEYTTIGDSKVAIVKMKNE